MSRQTPQRSRCIDATRGYHGTRRVSLDIGWHGRRARLVAHVGRPRCHAQAYAALRRLRPIVYVMEEYLDAVDHLARRVDAGPWQPPQSALPTVLDRAAFEAARACARPRPPWPAEPPQHSAGAPGADAPPAPTATSGSARPGAYAAPAPSAASGGAPAVAQPGAYVAPSATTASRWPSEPVAKRRPRPSTAEHLAPAGAAGSRADEASRSPQPSGGCSRGSAEPPPRPYPSGGDRRGSSSDHVGPSACPGQADADEDAEAWAYRPRRPPAPQWNDDPALREAPSEHNSMTWAMWRQCNKGVARRSARNDVQREQWKALRLQEPGRSLARTRTHTHTHTHPHARTHTRTPTSTVGCMAQHGLWVPRWRVFAQRTHGARVRCVPLNRPLGWSRLWC